MSLRMLNHFEIIFLYQIPLNRSVRTCLLGKVCCFGSARVMLSNHLEMYASVVASFIKKILVVLETLEGREISTTVTKDGPKISSFRLIKMIKLLNKLFASNGKFYLLVLNFFKRTSFIIWKQYIQ
jgi:hypothetical protein